MTRLATSSAAHDGNNVTEITQFELSKALIQSKFFSKVKLTASARLVLMVLSSHFPNIYPSIKTIQEESGIASKQSVISALKELARNGLIFYETKKSNNYTFTGLFFGLVGVQKLDTNKQDNKKNNKRFKNLNETSSSEKSNNSEFPSSSERRIKMSYWKTSGEDERKTSKYHSDCHTKGLNYPKYTPEKVENTVSPSSCPAWIELRNKMKGRVE